MAERIVSDVRVHYPFSDGYSVILHPRQNFKIAIAKFEDIDDASRITIESDFLVFGDFCVKYDDESKKEVLYYEINQKYDCTVWAKRSSIYLGELLIRNSENDTICVCVYLEATDEYKRHLITIINPKNSWIKLKPVDNIKVVLYNECIPKANYDYSYHNLNDCFSIKHCSFEIIDPKSSELTSSYVLNDLPLMDTSYKYPELQVTQEKHFCFSFDCRNEKNISEDRYYAGIIKFTGTGSLDRSGEPNVKEISFLNIWMSIKDKYKNKVQSLRDLTDRHLDLQTQILINPYDLDNISLYEPNLSLELEIAEPSLWHSDSDAAKWDLSWTKGKECSGNGFIVQSLGDTIAKRLDKEYLTQRFRILADCSGILKDRIEQGIIYLTCGSKFMKTIHVFINPPKTVAYHKNYYKPTTHRANAYWYAGQEQTHFTSDVSVSKINGDFITGVQTKLSPKIICPIVTPKLLMGPKPLEKSLSDDLIIERILSGPSENCYIRRNQSLVIKIVEDDYYKSINFPWNCCVFQNKTYLINNSNSVTNVNGKMVQIFNFSVYPHYLPVTNEVYHYLGGIKFTRLDPNKSDHPQVKRVTVNLTHGSRYDCNYSSDSSYLASAYLERFNNKTGGNSSSLVISKENNKNNLTFNNWKNNAGIVLHPEFDYHLNMPNNDTSVKWQAKFKQYAIPSAIWNEIQDKSGIDKNYPWWPEELHPDYAFGSYSISSVIDYQPRLYELLELYNQMFLCSSIPIGEIIFRSGIIVQNREDVSGTLVKVRQRYLKKVYLYADHLSERLLNQKEQKTNFLEIREPKDGISLEVCENKDLHIIYENTYKVVAMPHWMRLKEVLFSDNKSKTYVFQISKCDVDLLPVDEKLYPSGWLILISEATYASDIKIVRIKLSLGSYLD